MSLIIIGKKEKKKADSREKGGGEGRVGSRKYRASQHRHELTGAKGKPKAGQGLALTHQGRDARGKVPPAP